MERAMAGGARSRWPLLGALALGLALAACDEKNEYKPPPPPAVTVAPPLRQPVTEYLELTGSTAAFQSVDLVARVEGYLQSIEFADGAVVPEGKQLFVIEPAPYEAKVAQAQAAVEQQQAALTQAEQEYERQQRLAKDNATATANVEQAKASRDSAQAAVDQANADLTQAQINLGYTKVAAPFVGRMGRHLVDVGNLVGYGSPTTLANIAQIDPLYVYFTLNEIDVLKVNAAMRARGVEKAPVGTLPVYVGLQTEQDYPHEGTLDFVDNTLDASTGVLQLRARLPNGERLFLPGLFVRVRVPLGPPSDGLFVPDAAVGYDQAGHYLLLVGADNKVERRTVEIGVKDGSLRQIKQGLAAGDKVVINGLQAAVPGNVVNPSDGQIAADPPAEPPPAATPPAGDQPAKQQP